MQGKVLQLLQGPAVLLLAAGVRRRAAPRGWLVANMGGGGRWGGWGRRGWPWGKRGLRMRGSEWRGEGWEWREEGAPGRSPSRGPRASPELRKTRPPLVSSLIEASLPSPQQRKKVAREACTSAWLVCSMAKSEGESGVVTMEQKLHPPGPSWRCLGI